MTKLELDASHKDWAVAWMAGGQPPRLSPTVYRPHLTEATLLPTTDWPFDHAMVLVKAQLLAPVPVEKVGAVEPAAASDGRTDDSSTTFSFKDGRSLTTASAATTLSTRASTLHHGLRWRSGRRRGEDDRAI